MKYKLSSLIYKLGSIKNRNMDVTNLEIGYYQNKKGRFYDLYLQHYILVLGTCYEIEEDIVVIYNAVLNSSLLLKCHDMYY